MIPASLAMACRPRSDQLTGTICGHRVGRSDTMPGEGKLREFRGVETGYGKLKILRGIDMKVDAQGIIALLNGKSTLLNAISGSHKDIYAFLLLIFVLMVRPTGLMGRLAKVKA